MIYKEINFKSINDPFCSVEMAGNPGTFFMIKLNPYCKVSPLVPEEFSSVIRYFLDSSPEECKMRGTDASKFPSFEDWYAKMLSEYEKPLKEKNYLCLGWYYKDELIGHSAIDNIAFGQTARFHLHIWEADLRHKKLGRTLLYKSLKYYFQHFQLKTIICEPNAENKAPNNLLLRLGFKKIKTYETIPHLICLKQEVTRYKLDKLTLDSLDLGGS
jgi:[ribosomal protein S5]-alanine N-acetyltransferase